MEPEEVAQLPRDDSGEDEEEDRRRTILLLLLLLLVPICLCLVTQLAVLSLRRNSIEANILSGMQADYGPWDMIPFNPVDPVLIATIRADQLTQVAGRGTPDWTGLIPFLPLEPPFRPTDVVEATVVTLTPTPTSTIPPDTPTPFVPTPTSTFPPPPLPTLTLTPVPSATNTATLPSPATDTPIPPPPPTDTPTFTPTPVPTVSFLMVDFVVDEGAGSIVITVVLSAPAGAMVNVDYTTGNGTATAPGDYTTTSGTLTFLTGQQTQTFPVPITDDATNEGTFPEYFSLTLSNPVNVALGLSAATVWITDDDVGWPACPGSSTPEPGGGPEAGLPDGAWYELTCDDEIILDLGASPVVTSGDAAYDLVYYERGYPANPPGDPEPFIYLDWIIVQVGATPTGPWFTVFYWGDNIADANTSLGGLTPETNNLTVYQSMGLFTSPNGYISGIAIDVDARAPAGTYQYVRLYTPYNPAGDEAEIDAVHRLPWP